MKAKTTTLLLTFLLFLSQLGYAKDLVLTFDKCGSHFLLYSLQAITERSVHYNSYAHYTKFDLPVDLNKPPLDFTHTPEFIHTLPPVEKHKLLVLVRNPIELLLRFYGWEGSMRLLQGLCKAHPISDETVLCYDRPNQPTFIRGKKELKQFLSIVEMYHNHPKDKRLLTFYEELIGSPKKTLHKALTFFNEDTSNLDHYIEHFTENAERAREKYTAMLEGKSPLAIISSDGKDPLYYSRRQTQEEIEQLVFWAKKIIPAHLQPYFQHLIYQSLTLERG